MITDLLRAELAPSPRRVRLTVRTSLAVTLSLGVALVFQLDNTFVALVTMFAVKREVLCTWRNMVSRIAFAAATSAATVPIAGILVGAPWLMLPVYGLALAVGGSLLPAARHTLEWLAIKTAVVTILYGAVYEPSSIGTTALNVFIAQLIPIVTITVFQRLLWPERVEDVLRAALAADLASAAGVLDALGNDAPATRARLDELARRSEPRLAEQLTQLEQLQQEIDDPHREALALALVTASSRAWTQLRVLVPLYATRADGDYLRELEPDLDALRTSVARALRSYAVYLTSPAGSVARRGGGHATDAAAAAALGPWPAFDEQLADLARHRDAIRDRRLGRRVDVVEAAWVDGVVDLLTRLAEVVHDPPATFATIVTPAPRAATPPFFAIDHGNVVFASRVGIAATVAFVVGLASNHPELVTAQWTCLQAAQRTHGATLRKGMLRVIGATIGGVLALLLMIGFLPSVGDFAFYLLSILLVLLPCIYVSLGSERVAYGGFQAGVSFLLAYYATSQAAHVDEALWRVFGILVGDAILFATLAATGPDRASSAIRERLATIYRALVELAPHRSATPIAAEREDALIRNVARSSHLLIDLAEQARYEDAHFDVAATTDAAGVARRVAGRLSLLADGRRALAGALPPSVVGAVDRLEHELDVLLDDGRRAIADAAPSAMSGAAATSATSAPSAAHREDVAARGDLAELAATLLETVEDARAEIAPLPAASRSAIYAEVAHWQRLATLVPRLTQSVGARRKR